MSEQQDALRTKELRFKLRLSEVQEALEALLSLMTYLLVCVQATNTLSIIVSFLSPFRDRNIGIGNAMNIFVIV